MSKNSPPLIKRRRNGKEVTSTISHPINSKTIEQEIATSSELETESSTQSQGLVDSVLLSSFVHQVINPLSGIVGTLFILENHNFPEHKRMQRIRATRSQLSHTIEMVRNLAFLSQLSTDQGSSSLKEVAVKSSVQRLILEAIQFFQESAARKKIRLHLEDSAIQHYVKTHSELLKHVFINLFDNAVKYADEESQITVTCRQQKSTKNLIVEVSNFGNGFSYDESKQIFDLGFRGTQAKAKTSNGSGIGLYVCKRILDILHNATIEGEHSPAKRITTLRIRFPEVELGENYEKSEESIDN